MRIREIKKSALQVLKGRWGQAVIVALGYLIVMAAFSIAQRILGGNPGAASQADLQSVLLKVHTMTPAAAVVSLVEFFVLPPLTYGIVASYIRFTEGEKVGIFDYIAYGFKHYGKSWAVMWWPFLRLLGWIVLMFVFLAVFLVAVTLLSASQIAPAAGTAVAIVAAVIFIALLVVITVKGLLYSATAYVMFKSDNALKGRAATEKSAAMMNGSRCKYFLLNLSFIGWAILAIITIGIGFLWLLPYIEVSCIILFKWLENNSSPASGGERV